MKTGALFQQYVVGGSAGPVASLPLRIHAGLGPQATVDWLRIMWPDAILQGEVEMAADRVVAIEEQSRKPSSCPYLFAWDGERFAFVADFGGVGGLGYYLGNGRYASPDPTEYLPIPKLEPRDGHYVLQSLTPLEEITYLDEVKLLAIDHPRGNASPSPRDDGHQCAAAGVRVVLRAAADVSGARRRSSRSGCHRFAAGHRSSLCRRNESRIPGSPGWRKTILWRWISAISLAP